MNHDYVGHIHIVVHYFLCVKCILISAPLLVSIPGSGEVMDPSSPLELKNTSKASWSETSISSI